MSSIIADVQSALQDIWNWFQGLANPVENTLGTLGTWLFAGIKWLADQIYNAWKWLADRIHDAISFLATKFHEAYSVLAQWVSGGLQWIGSGLSWIGQHIYAFGQWLWNGILWIARTAATLFENFINWIWHKIYSIWNGIVSTIEGFIDAMNDHVNSWIESIRDKFINMIAVNLSIEGLFKSLDSFHQGNWKMGIAGLFLSPIAGAITASIIDSIVPKPHTTKVMIFPKLSIPSLTFEPITVEKPPIPSKPTYTSIPQQPIIPVTIGYTPNTESYSVIESSYEYSIKLPSLTQKKTYSSINSGYETLLKMPNVKEVFSNLSSEYLVSVNKLTTEYSSNLSSGYEYITGHLSELFKAGVLSSGYSLSAKYAIKIGESNIVSSKPLPMIIMPLIKSIGNTIDSSSTPVLISPVSEIEGNPASSNYEINLVKPEVVTTFGSMSSSYEYYISSSKYNVIIYESFEK